MNTPPNIGLAAPTSTDDVNLVIPTLEMASISKSFSGVAALTDVSLEVLPGEVHALLGENGAGKSTLMNVASGVLQSDSGTITVCGQALSGLNPTQAAALGIAIVFQHPAVMLELTVEENLLVALPKSFFDKSESVEAASKALLASVGLNVHLKDRVELLTVAQTHLLEVAKALALKPKLLILDEPTAPLGQDSVELLFGLIRSAVAGGTSVVYITHRMAEVRELADRVTVLRDGRVRGTSAVDAITDRELLTLIVGRQLDSTFPEKHHATESDGDNFVLDGFTGPGFVDVSVKAVRGEIVGIAGVVGNGQSDVMRALAGLESFTGSVTVQGKKFASRDLLHKAAFMPSDRQHEGLMLTLSVRENAAVSALVRFKRWFLLSRKKEIGRVGDTLHSLSVKALSMDATVASLSGGNQQKVVMARALLSEPALLVADEPTQGVDVGARAEIYRILREVSDSGIPVIVNSSDAKELEGLCDWVIVMSRGQAVETLSGGDITEERIVEAAVSSTAHAVETDTAILNQATSSSFGRFIRGDYSPAALLAVVIVGLAAYITTQNGNYLGAFNVYSILTLVAALGFIAMGQTVALLIGGIDLSVGPLAGFLVVIASFFINDNKPFGTIVFGLVLMVIFAAVVGLVNGSLIRFLRFTPIAATLTVYIALGGFALLLRPKPGGYINSTVSNIISAQLGPIPVAFIVLVVLTLVVEYFLRQRRWGWRLRATGSSEESARRTGVKINRTVIFAYVVVALFTFLGAIMLAAQIGVGDASQGTTYTLTSITAVVLGGTSLLGGRGSFVGTLFGSILLTQVLNATTFLGLSQFWQYLFQGLLIIGAAVLYSIARSRKKKREALS